MKALRALLLLFVALTAGAAHGQLCTVDCDGNAGNGVTACTTAQSVSTVESRINAAPDNGVVCLRRGNVWNASPGSGQSGLRFTASHPDVNRAIVCASNDTQCDPCPGGQSTCTTVGGANPKLLVTTATTGEFDSTGGLNFAGGVNGWEVRFLDVEGAGTSCSGNSNSALLKQLSDSADILTISNIRFVGGKWSKWAVMAWPGSAAGKAGPTNIEFGTCSNNLEFSDCTQIGFHSYAWWGMAANTKFRLNMHDFCSNDGSSQAHLLDFTNEVTGEPLPNGIVVECGRYTINGGSCSGTSTLFKLPNGQNITFQDNVFENTGASCGSFHTPIGLGESHCAPNYWNGAVIRRNLFKMGQCHSPAIEVEFASDSEIYNNVFDLTKPPYTAGDGKFEPIRFWNPFSDQFPCGSLLAGGNVNNHHVYNNTFYLPPRPGAQQMAALKDQAGNGGSGHQFYNNLVQFTAASTDSALAQLASCNSFGLNGQDIHHNYVYSPSDSTPLASVGSCSAASTLPGSPWATNPGLVNPAAGNYSITTASPVYGLGTATAAPTTDFTGGTRPSPPSIGAYDVTTGGPPASSITVTMPNGGEQLQPSGIFGVTWTWSGTIPSVKVEHTVDGAAWVQDAAATSNTGSYSLTLPATPTTSFKVRLTNTGDPLVTDASDGFATIVSPPVPSAVDCIP